MEKGKLLCPDCKTGKQTYQIDKKSVMCPYIRCHNGKRCSMYVPIKDKAK